MTKDTLHLLLTDLWTDQGVEGTNSCSDIIEQIKDSGVTVVNDTKLFDLLLLIKRRDEDFDYAEKRVQSLLKGLGSLEKVLTPRKSKPGKPRKARTTHMKRGRPKLDGTVLDEADRGDRCDCGSLKSKVVDVRNNSGKLRRRRECLACGARWSTKEIKIID